MKYRATIQGPGVTPDVMWEGVPLGEYDKAPGRVVERRDRPTERHALPSELGDEAVERRARAFELPVGGRRTREPPTRWLPPLL